MVETAGRESPLVACHPMDVAGANGPVVFSERPCLTHLNLRGDLEDAAFAEAVANVIGFALPAQPNTVNEGKACVACWLGPNEWLLIAEEEQSLVQGLHQALSDLFAAVTDVSSGQTIIRISGPCARDVMAKGCTLDLHPRVFGAGQCAQSGLAKTNVLIRFVDDTPAFDIVVRRSFAEYLWVWLEDAAKEYV